MLKFHNINKAYQTLDGKKVIFNDYNLAINEGEIVAIIGSNGTGKSTLTKLLTGDIPLDSGDITIMNKSVINLPTYKRKKIISSVYQDPRMGTAENMTVLENMSLADNKGKSYGFRFCINKKRISFYKEQLKRLNLGLEDKLNVEVRQLSGGQRQAIALLMITLNPPKILILDEHTSALDPKTSKVVMDMTRRLIKEHNITTIMISHNLDIVREYSDRVVTLKAS